MYSTVIQTLFIFGFALFTVRCNGANTCSVLSDVNGCSTPLGLDLPHKVQFTPACLHHDVCYRCGQMYKWTQMQCDESFKKKMYEICQQINTPPNNGLPAASLSLSKIKEVYDKIRQGWKKATENKTSVEEAKRLWESAKTIAKLVIKWMVASNDLTKCQYAADVYYEAVKGFGVYKFRSQSKSHCSESCAKNLGIPY